MRTAHRCIDGRDVLLAPVDDDFCRLDIRTICINPLKRQTPDLTLITRGTSWSWWPQSELTVAIFIGHGQLIPPASAAHCLACDSWRAPKLAPAGLSVVQACIEGPRARVHPTGRTGL